MYPKNYCSGDSHEYPGYACPVCDGGADGSSTMGGHVSNDYQTGPSSDKEDDAKAWHDVSDSYVDDPMPRWSPNGSLLNIEPVNTFDVVVDSWATPYYSDNMRMCVHEAPCAAAKPDGVVRVPNDIFVRASFDGSKYTVTIRRNENFLRHTRQSYIKQAANAQAV